MIEALYPRLGYVFHDVALLKTALTHRSTGGVDNERLEFLGDAVLGAVVAERLYRRCPPLKEGKMTQTRSALVNGHVLFQLAEQLGIAPYVQLGPGEKKSGGAHRASILSGTMEAIIGAIYLDGGMAAAQQCITHWVDQYWQFEQLCALEHIGKSPKSQLQEYMQARKKPIPEYVLIERHGKAHDLDFCVSCRVEGLAYVGKGCGSSIKKAEQEAAQHYLTLLEQHGVSGD